MLLYRLSTLLHDDSRYILHHAEKNFGTMAGWVEEIPDIAEGRIMRMNL